MKNEHYFTVGVDEVGRGPIAGPLTVCAVLVPSDFNIASLGRVRDSKQLNVYEREEIFEKVSKEAVQYAVSSITASTIDARGMRYALHTAVERVLRKLTLPLDYTRVLLDGSLHAPESYCQETIIRGDQKVPAIALASIIAKVTRDRTMVKYSTEYPDYGFEQHKGYGTKRHFEAIEKNGPCSLHRLTYLKSVEHVHNMA